MENIKKLFEGEIRGRRKDKIGVFGWKKCHTWFAIYCEAYDDPCERFIIYFPNPPLLYTCLDEGWEPNCPDYYPMAELDWCFLKLDQGDLLEQYHKYTYDMHRSNYPPALYKFYFDNEIFEIVAGAEPIIIKDGFDWVKKEGEAPNIIDKFSPFSIIHDERMKEKRYC